MTTTKDFSHVPTWQLRKALSMKRERVSWGHARTQESEDAIYREMAELEAEIRSREQEGDS